MILRAIDDLYNRYSYPDGEKAQIAFCRGISAEEIALNTALDGITEM